MESIYWFCLWVNSCSKIYFLNNQVIIVICKTWLSSFYDLFFDGKKVDYQFYNCKFCIFVDIER